MQDVVRTFQSAKGERRVHIKKRSDAGFTFVIEELVHHYDEELREALQDYEMIWVPVHFGGIYDTSEAAELGARGCECWLN